LFPTQKDGQNVRMVSYLDADWCGDKDERKITAGYCFFLSKAPLTWCSKKESIVALSICESEYIASGMSTCQAAWLDSLMTERRIKDEEEAVINKGSINIFR
jgi:hypothetical protein